MGKYTTKGWLNKEDTKNIQQRKKEMRRKCMKK
jgi:hypothetical protein